MSATENIGRDPVSDEPDSPVTTETDSVPNSTDGDATVPAKNASNNSLGIPRWRQIEIMKERRELREMLDDIDIEEDPDWDEEIFGSEEERRAYYRVAGEDLEEDDEDFSDDDDDDLEDSYEDDSET